MKIKNLFYLLLALPMMLVACEQEGENGGNDVKNPTVAVEAGEATESTLSFTVTTTDADAAAYMVVKASESVPSVAVILENGTAVEVNTAKACTVSELEAGVEYAIVAAAKNSKALVKSDVVKMTTTANGNDGGNDGGNEGGNEGGNDGGNEGGDEGTPVKLATPTVTGMVAGNAVTVSWNAIAGAKDYTVTLNGEDVDTVTTAYKVYTNLAYSTAYTVTVVANPADATKNLASDAGSATFTTEADPNAGDEGGNDDGGNDDGGDQGGSADAVEGTLKYIKNLGGNYTHIRYYELTAGQDVVGFWIASGKESVAELNNGTYTHTARGGNGVIYDSKKVYVEKLVLSGILNNGVQETSTIEVAENGANITFTIDYNYFVPGGTGSTVERKIYTFKGTITE